jgi:hypothetical protein
VTCASSEIRPGRQEFSGQILQFITSFLAQDAGLMTQDETGKDE